MTEERFQEITSAPIISFVQKMHLEWLRKRKVSIDLEKEKVEKNTVLPEEEKRKKMEEWHTKWHTIWIISSTYNNQKEFPEISFKDIPGMLVSISKLWDDVSKEGNLTHEVMKKIAWDSVSEIRFFIESCSNE